MIHTNEPRLISLSLSHCMVLRPDGKAVIEVKDVSGESLYSFSSQRLIFMKQYLMNQLSPGKYSFAATIQDLIGNDTVTAQASFEVVSQ